MLLHSTRPFQVRHWTPAAVNTALATAPALRDFQADGDRLPDFCLLLLGVGAVNGLAMRAVASLGVGTIVVCDPDEYDAASHWTQPVERGLAGEPKVFVQAAEVHRRFPAARIVAIRGFAQDIPLSVVRGADLILLAGDNLDLLVYAARAAAGLGKTLIEAAVMGDSRTAHLRRYPLSDPAHACPACGMNDQEWRDLRSRIGCAGELRAPLAQPTRTSPALCGVAASMAACEVAREIEGSSSLLGEDVTYSLSNHKLFRTTLPRSEACRLPHRPWRVEDFPEDPSELTLRAVIARGVREHWLHPHEGPLQCQGEIPWIHEVRCRRRGCAAMAFVGRFARLGEAVGECRCGRPLTAAAFGQRSVIPAADLKQRLDEPLSALGLRRGAAIKLSTNGDDWTYSFVGRSNLTTWLDEHSEEVIGNYRTETKR